MSTDADEGRISDKKRRRRDYYTKKVKVQVIF